MAKKNQKAITSATFKVEATPVATPEAIANSDANWKKENKKSDKKKELQAANAELSRCLMDYNLLTQKKVSEITKLFDLDDFFDLREQYSNLLLTAFSFEGNLIKASESDVMDNDIKKFAGEFIKKLALERGHVEFGVIHYVATAGNYISNTSIDLLETISGQLIDSKLNRTIADRLNHFLSLGGMKQPGSNNIVPFHEDKKKRLIELTKKLQSPYLG